MKQQRRLTHIRRARAWRQTVLGLLLVLLITGCARPYEFRGSFYDPAKPAAEIAGPNWDGATFHLSEQRGKIVLIFFGYTFCPDVCPLTLSEMKTVYSDLGEKAASVAVVFVTVDPERDTPARLAEYVPIFDARFYGVHLDPAALDAAKVGYGVIAEKRSYDAQTSAIGYTVDHTARVFLVDRAGNLRLSFPFGTPVEDIIADVLHLLK